MRCSHGDSHTNADAPVLLFMIFVCLFLIEVFFSRRSLEISLKKRIFRRNCKLCFFSSLFFCLFPYDFHLCDCIRTCTMEVDGVTVASNILPHLCNMRATVTYIHISIYVFLFRCNNIERDDTIVRIDI